LFCDAPLPVPLPEYRPARAGLVSRDDHEANVYETVTCTACQQVHLVNPVNGNVLIGDDDQ
jgi:hypothetical protein